MCHPSSVSSTSEGQANEPNVKADAKVVRKVMGRYAVNMDKESLLGRGSFSVCRKGVDLSTGEAVAIKAYKIQHGSNDWEVTLLKFQRQVEVLQTLQGSQKLGKFFVRLLDFSKDSNGSPGPDLCDGCLYVITELAEHSLKDFLSVQRASGQVLSSQAVRSLARSVVMAAAALHDMGYVHLDLKPENMMFFNGRLKIIDVDGCVAIGSTVSLQDSSRSFSPCYCAPEWARFMQGGEQSEIVAEPQLDAWSVGLTLCELVTLSAVLRPALTHFLKSVDDSTEAHEAFIDWLGKLETSPLPQCVEQFDAGLGEVALGLLACDSNSRLTPSQCLSSPIMHHRPATGQTKCGYPVAENQPIMHQRTVQSVMHQQHTVLVAA